MIIKTLKQAEEIAGVLGNVHKMPGYSYGLPANRGTYVPAVCNEKGWTIPPQYGCNFGAKLAKVEGTPCFNCYADERGNYTYPSVHVNRTKHAVAIFHPLWKYAMVKLIGHRTDPLDPYFRWVDSGDVVNAQMLEDIFWIARQLPTIKFWLPTQERKIVRDVLSRTSVPDNLCIRISSAKVDNHNVKERGNLCSSSVSTTGNHDCPSELHANTCGPCRACWDTEHKHTIYKEH